MSEETKSAVEYQLFNVMVSRKTRGKRTQQSYFTLRLPVGVDPYTGIVEHVRKNYNGWILGGFAPASTPAKD